ncbi:hypothetical protein ACA910_014924 [Epithemia clementina (nom. ined.)]
MWTQPFEGSISRQGNLGDSETRKKIAEKLNDVRRKGYITAGPCLATMNYFAVPKGDSDLRMVYDGTKSGLINCLFAPWFPLPDADALVNVLDDAYWCVDNDYGEMFLNFWLHSDLQQYSGMDITDVCGRGEKTVLIEVWSRCPMGQSPSPYVTVQQTCRLKRIMLGERLDSNNVFNWSHVRLNLPRTQGYQPGIPWILKRRSNGQIVADAQDYMDDLRGCAPSEEDAWQVGTRIAKVAAFHGIQDAAHKRRKQTQRPGAWAGVVCGTRPSRPFVSVTQEKWDKTKQEVQRLTEEVRHAQGEGRRHVSHKVLEQVAGFLNHVARAFPTIKIYLNGVYATLNAWQPYWDEDGWKNGQFKVEYNTSAAPKRVRMVKRMIFNVEALDKLTSSPTPPERFLRPEKEGSKPIYIFGDASGAGFGVSQWRSGDTEVKVTHGIWNHDQMAGSSSNFRELANLVYAIKYMDANNEISAQSEIFIFTDNQHTESAFYRGTAKSPEVLQLMFKLHKILIKGYAFIHIIWVAGRRMIDQGTDGLSRSDLTNGVLRGVSMLHYVPLARTAFERQEPAIKEFLGSILGRERTSLHFLSFKEWFYVPQDSKGLFIWSPPPCLGDVAVYLMAEHLTMEHSSLLDTLRHGRVLAKDALQGGRFSLHFAVC